MPRDASHKLVNRLRLDCLGQFAGKIDRGRRKQPVGRLSPFLRQQKESVPFWPPGPGLRLPRAGQALRQVRLARAAGTVENQGVVARGRLFQDGTDGHLGKAVFRPGEEMAAPGPASTAAPGATAVPPMGISTTPSTIWAPSSI